MIFPHDRGRGNFRGPCLLSSGPLPVPQLPQHLGGEEQEGRQIGDGHQRVAQVHQLPQGETSATRPRTVHRRNTAR